MLESIKKKVNHSPESIIRNKYGELQVGLFFFDLLFMYDKLSDPIYIIRSWTLCD